MRTAFLLPPSGILMVRTPSAVFSRSLDGGETWQKVLYKDEDTGAIDLAMDPEKFTGHVSSMWASRCPPSTDLDEYNGPGSGLYKSTDGGVHWRQITKGLPTEADKLGRIGFAVSLRRSGWRLRLGGAKKNVGVYRSDDAGESWQLVNTEERVSGRGFRFRLRAR